MATETITVPTKDGTPTQTQLDWANGVLARPGDFGPSQVTMARRIIAAAQK